MKQILAFRHAQKSYDSKVVPGDITLAFLPGAKIGVAGPNGMGKSTLLQMMAGLEQPSNGEVLLMPGYSAGILPQEPELDENGIAGVIGPNGTGKTTLLKMILGEEQSDAGTSRIGETVRISYAGQLRGGINPDKTVWEVISGGEACIRTGRAEIPSRAYAAASGFKGSGQQKLAGLMFGGERGRVNLALTLRQGGSLLLDEPANDLDVETLALLEDALGEFPGCGDHQPRPVVPGPGRDPHPGLEGGANWFWFKGNFAAYEKNKTGRLGEEAARPHRVTYRKLTR